MPRSGRSTRLKQPRGGPGEGLVERVHLVPRLFHGCETHASALLRHTAQQARSLCLQTANKSNAPGELSRVRGFARGAPSSSYGTRGFQTRIQKKEG